MWTAILAGLLVSIDAFFIGISFGTQKRCKFWHIIAINIGLFLLCILGYFLGVWIGNYLDLELDLVIGMLFITLGLWVMLSYFLFEHRKKKDSEDAINNKKQINIWLTGIFMSIEAMFITIALVLTLNVTTILIPITVALAHFVYCTITFFLAKYLRRFPPMLGHVISGVALIVYGVLAIVI